MKPHLLPLHALSFYGARQRGDTHLSVEKPVKGCAHGRPDIALSVSVLIRLSGSSLDFNVIAHPVVGVINQRERSQDNIRVNSAVERETEPTD